MIKITTREQFEQFKVNWLGPIISTKFFSDRIEIITYEDKVGDNGKESRKEEFQLPINCSNWINQHADEYANDLIFGKDKTRNVVSVEVKDGLVYIYTETSEGVKLETRTFKYWIMSNLRPQGIHIHMDGDLHFKYLKEFDTEKEWKDALSKLWRAQADKYCCYDQREAFLVRHGLTYFKGMKVEDVSLVSFDLETTTLSPDDPEAKVLLISNTVRINGIISRKLFALDEFKNELSMLQSWCNWIREINPTILVGHNIYAFDWKYLDTRIKICGVTQVGIERNTNGLKLGRDDSIMEISDKVSQIRKDGSQSYDYHKVFIFGREVIDTFFLALKYDISRSFPSYGLKPIIEHLELEKEGRIKWDFSKNKPKDFFGKDVELTKQFKEYCNDDADDSLKLFDIMIPSFFYLTQKTPKAFQTINETATGKQIDQILIRGYLQLNHSLPKQSEAVPFEGAISFGIPGIYTEGFSMDFASLYPSIIREFKIYDRVKDPLGLMLQLVDTLTLQRLHHKKIAKETGDKKYKDLEQSEKVVINSIYGFMGASGLLFNSPENAALVTKYGRELLSAITMYCTGKSIEYWKGQIEN